MNSWCRVRQCEMVGAQPVMTRQLGFAQQKAQHEGHYSKALHGRSCKNTACLMILEKQPGN